MTKTSSALPVWLRNALFALAVVVAFISGAVLFGDASAPEPNGEAASATWTCSMHPQIRAEEPGDCPICGMDLIEVGAAAATMTDRVVLSDRARVLAGIRTSPVERQADASAQVRLLGRVEAAETTRRNVTTWIGGRIDDLRVNTTGETVRRGQVIATLYSPDVYGAHQDLLAAQSQAQRLSSSPAAAQQAALRALASAQERLRLLGVPQEEVDRMADATEPTRSIAIRSPFSGTVIERVATEGAYVDTGATLYQVADLDTLWVQLDAYESDLARLAIGQSVELSVDALPGETFTGRVAFIEPTVDSQRRTARVRVEVNNADGRLRPGLFAEAVVSATPSGDAPLTIPVTAPLFTGRRSVVYVEVPSAQGVAYAARTVRLGPRLGDRYPVVSGLNEGERVVSRGAFAIDADLQIQGGDAMMTAPDDTSPAPVEPVRLTADERAAFEPVVQAYLDVQRALAEDDRGGAQIAAARLITATTTLDVPVPAASEWPSIATPLRQHAAVIAESRSIEAARAGFESLSADVEVLLVRIGNPLNDAVQVAYCPMANRNHGARWVQSDEVVDNAYFGASMRNCGDVVHTIAPGRTLDATVSVPRAIDHSGHNH